MTTTRKKYTSEFKINVVGEVLSHIYTLIEIASKHNKPPYNWTYN